MPAAKDSGVTTRAKANDELAPTSNHVRGIIPWPKYDSILMDRTHRNKEDTGSFARMSHSTIITIVIP